jgi:hypothetical protein
LNTIWTNADNIAVAGRKYLVLKYLNVIFPNSMAQYKHDRFFKFYIQSLYRSKGNTIKNIQIHNDEDLEIDLMFLGDFEKEGWKEQNLGLFDRLMQVHPTIIVEHYSSYLEEADINKSITRKNLYWTSKLKELNELAKTEGKLTNTKRLSNEAIEQIENQNPFTWILTVNCSEKLLKLCNATADLDLGAGVYRLAGLLRMGIVVIERLPPTSENLWLKMLGNGESARKAFRELEQLSTPARTVKNDIMAACWKYCVYLKDLGVESLTTEESEFMKTMEELDALYDAEMNRARLEGEARGKLEGKLEGEERQKQTIALNLLRKNIPLEIISEATGLTIEQIQNLRSNN